MQKNYLDRYLDALQLLVWFFQKEPLIGFVGVLILLVFLIGVSVVVANVINAFFFMARMTVYVVKTYFKRCRKRPESYIISEVSMHRSIDDALSKNLPVGDVVLIGEKTYVVKPGNRLEEIEPTSRDH